MKEKDALSLLKKYRTRTATEEERNLLESWYVQWNDEADESFSEAILMELAGEMRSKMPAKKRITPLWKRLTVAASIAGLLLAGYYIYTTPDRSELKQVIAVADVNPGKNTARLTLDNGKTIVLSEDKKGVVIDANQLIYDDGTALGTTFSSAQKVTISTPRGGTYQVVLPDGTRVWLNASSEIKFSSGFTGMSQRKVELIGEAYFEVKKDKNRPFVVNSNQQDVTVLGTRFNISAYGDENITTTTLLEGSIQLSGIANASAQKPVPVILKPGQQAMFVSGKPVAITNIESDEAIAWKEGRFDFNDVELKVIMRQISRWYNVDVVFQGDVGVLHFAANIARTEKLSKVLEMLEETGVLSFKIEGNRVIVKRKN